MRWVERPSVRTIVNQEADAAGNGVGVKRRSQREAGPKCRSNKNRFVAIVRPRADRRPWMPLPKAENRTFEGCIHMQMLFGHSGLAMLTPFGRRQLPNQPRGVAARARWARKRAAFCVIVGSIAKGETQVGPGLFVMQGPRVSSPLRWRMSKTRIVRSGPKSWRVRRRDGLILVAPLAEPRHRSRIQRFRAVCLTAGRTALQRMPPFGPAGKCSQLSIDV